MNESTKNLFEVIFKFLAIIGSIIGFSYTIITWREQVHIKRAEFLENKITEFNDSSTYLAIAILDSFAIRYENTSNLSIRQLVDSGSSRENHPKDIGVWNLNSTLDHAWPVTENSEQRVRRSFDNLLDFFGKLEYYVDLNLMTKYEIRYFEYYLESCARRKAVIDYAKKYNFDLFLALLKRMKIKY